MKSAICSVTCFFVLCLVARAMAQADATALRSAEEWERLGGERAQREHEQEYLPRSRSVNSWQFYNLAYGIDGNLAFFEATGKKEYLDRALSYAENCAASAKPSRSLPASQYKDDFLGWPAMNHPIDRSIRGGEYPLYESYCWRYVTRLLRVIRRTPAIWTDEDYRRRYAALLDFTEKYIFDKWWTRGQNHLYRSRTHMASHWAYIGLELSLLTDDADRKARCIEVYSKINRGLPNGSSLRGQLQPHRIDKSAYFWASEWKSKDPPGQDVSHGNNMLAYVVEAHDLGVEFTKEDIAAFSALLLNVLWKPAEAGGTYAAFVDGSGKGNGWFNDGFMKLGRYNAEIQKRLETHTVGRGVQFYGNGALNARRLVAGRLPDAFRGNSLAQWTTLDGRPITQGWEASDGEIRLNRSTGRGGHIVTAGEFSDFDLSFEWKIAARGNSGLKYRVRKYGDQTLGLEYQICDEPEGRNVSRKSAGALYDLYEPAAKRLLKPAGEWNSARIVVRGDRIEHWLNGELIVAATVGDEQWRRRIAESKFADEEKIGENRSGQIMLTDHGSDVAYRDFVFRPLTTAP